jgi:hypothetical protein
MQNYNILFNKQTNYMIIIYSNAFLFFIIDLFFNKLNWYN